MIALTICHLAPRVVAAPPMPCVVREPGYLALPQPPSPPTRYPTTPRSQRMMVASQTARACLRTRNGSCLAPAGNLVGRRLPYAVAQPAHTRVGDDLPALLGGLLDGHGVPHPPCKLPDTCQQQARRPVPLAIEDKATTSRGLQHKSKQVRPSLAACKACPSLAMRSQRSFAASFTALACCCTRHAAAWRLRAAS